MGGSPRREPRLGSGTRRGRTLPNPGQPPAKTALRRLSSRRVCAVAHLLEGVSASLMVQPSRERGPPDRQREALDGRRRGRPGVRLTSRRTPRPPAGRARTRAPAQGANPCWRPRSCARGSGWGCRARGEARSAPRRSCGRREPPAAAAATAAALGGERRGARPEQVCAAAPGAPSGSLPARGGAAGGAAPRAGRGPRTGGARARLAALQRRARGRARGP